MFATVQPRLAELGRSSADGFERVATFVLCTIRTPFASACADYPRVRRGEACPKTIFGMKRDGLAYLREHSAELIGELEWLNTAGAPTADMMRVVCRIPGIGLAKGGFILQMLYGRAGCLDTHNLQRYGIAPTRFKRATPAACADYLDTCERLGGCAALWDTWCQYLAERQPQTYDGADAVSQLHLAPLEC